MTKIFKSRHLEIKFVDGDKMTMSFLNDEMVEKFLSKLNSFFCRSILLGKKGSERILIVKKNISYVRFIGEDEK